MFYPHDNLYRYNIIIERKVVYYILLHLRQDKHLSYNFVGKNPPRSTTRFKTHFYEPKYHLPVTMVNSLQYA